MDRMERTKKGGGFRVLGEDKRTDRLYGWRLLDPWEILNAIHIFIASTTCYIVKSFRTKEKMVLTSR